MGNQTFQYQVALIQIAQKIIVHFRYSLPVNKKNILCEYLRSLSQKYVELFTPRMNKLVSTQLCIETTSSPCM